MARSETIRKLQRTLARNAFYLTRWLVSRLNHTTFRLLFAVLTAVGGPLIRPKKALARENLKLAFAGEKTEPDIERIADDCFHNFGKAMIDLIWFIDRPHLILEKVSIVGKEHLDRVLQDGKGAILVSAHFGNFILMYLRMVQEGYKTNVIMRRVRDRSFEKYISEFRAERGLRTIYDLPARQCVQQSIKALRNNELLFILLDQNYGGAGGIFVDFFGRPSATATGPVVFSTRIGSPILPAFIFHDGKDRHKIVIEPPLELKKTPEDQATLVENVAGITKMIEGHIRRAPHEWGGWMHRRWKNQPQPAKDA